MFTGLIEATATVINRNGAHLMITRPKEFTDIKIGSSIAVSGVCLTVTKMDEASLSFDLADVTQQKTTLGNIAKDQTVNLERAMPADGRFDGHIVQGHTEAKGTITDIQQQEDDWRVSIDIPHELAPSIIPHGSITIDGVSLTIASIEHDTITVALIPHTRTMTTLGNLQVGDDVNIETDIIGRYIAKKR